MADSLTPEPMREAVEAALAGLVAVYGSEAADDRNAAEAAVRAAEPLIRADQHAKTVQQCIEELEAEIDVLPGQVAAVVAIRSAQERLTDLLDEETNGG